MSLAPTENENAVTTSQLVTPGLERSRLTISGASGSSVYIGSGVAKPFLFGFGRRDGRGRAHHDDNASHLIPFAGRRGSTKCKAVV